MNNTLMEAIFISRALCHSGCEAREDEKEMLQRPALRSSAAWQTSQYPRGGHAWSLPADTGSGAVLCCGDAGTGPMGSRPVSRW